jgi:hypothetical protein
LIYQAAGVAGVNPGPLTLRELIAMAEGARRERWSRHAELLALIANCHRDPDKQRTPFTAWDFWPFDDPRPEQPKHSVHILKDLF